ncbi:MAG TPA: SRPBCC family protein [Candidatus Limnocylindrales bacterium]|nr:SRPBCC family protein [Candidatus Limnocylindrales bacterium]
MRTTLSAQRVMDVSPDVVYRCIVDYEHHHRPEGFLPPTFSDMRVIQGGIGAGTVVSWAMDLGGRHETTTATITEPDPGHVLVETSDTVVTTFTVEPSGGGALVRFDTVIDEPGLRGVMTRLFATRLLRPVYDDELQRLEEYARRLAASSAESGPVPG